MKRLFYILSVLFSLSLLLCVSGGCSRYGDGCGMVTLGLSSDAGDMEILTKTVSELGGDFIVVIDKSDGTNFLTKEYSELKEAFIMPEGSYNITVYNITEEEAIVDRGAIRYYGTSSFSISEGNMTDVNFTIYAVNAKLTVENCGSLAGYTVYAFESSDTGRQRELIFNANQTDPVYFNIDSNPEVTLVITGTVSGSQRNYIKRVTLSPGIWHKVNIDDN